MDLLKAKRIIADNYLMNENSLYYYLHEETEFSAAAFWEYYDAIAFIARNYVKDELLSAQIAIGYRNFLKEIIWHFDLNDVASIANFPENYRDYMERLEFAVCAYFEGKVDLLDDERFDLQR